MRKHILFAILFLISSFGASAQISLAVHQPPTGIITKEQLWNITLVNSSQAAQTVVVSISLFDQLENRQLLAVTSRPIVFNKGVRVLRAQEIGPFDYIYFSSEFSNNRIPEGFLPIGNYRACYSVLSDPKNPAALLAEDCISIEVSPLSPPQLNMPSDTAVVETAYPQFTWLPPMPLTLFSDLNYDLILTEVLKGQSPLSAIQENLPVLTYSRINQPFYNYPSSAKVLDPEKVYAWRIIARNGTQFAAQSDVWTFKIARNPAYQGKMAANAFVELKSGGQNNNMGTIKGDVLGVSYYSYEREREINFRFKDPSGNVVKEVKRNVLYGNNRVSFQLDKGFQSDTVYTVELIDLQGTSYSASFQIQK